MFQGIQHLKNHLDQHDIFMVAYQSQRESKGDSKSFTRIFNPWKCREQGPFSFQSVCNLHAGGFFLQNFAEIFFGIFSEGFFSGTLIFLVNLESRKKILFPESLSAKGILGGGVGGRSGSALPHGETRYSSPAIYYI